MCSFNLDLSTQTLQHQYFECKVEKKRRLKSFVQDKNTREGIFDGSWGMMRGRETCSVVEGKVLVRGMFSKQGTSGIGWEREGTCWRNQDGRDRGDSVSACGPCLSQIRRRDKPGRRKGLERQRLTWGWGSGCWPGFSWLGEQPVRSCKNHFSHCLAPDDSSHHQHPVQGVWAALAHGGDGSTCPALAKTHRRRHNPSTDHSHSVKTDSDRSVGTYREFWSYSSREHLGMVGLLGADWGYRPEVCGTPVDHRRCPCYCAQDAAASSLRCQLDSTKWREGRQWRHLDKWITMPKTHSYFYKHQKR